MGECMLDGYGEDGFQTSEGFDDWSTFSSSDWSEPLQDDNSLSNWVGFQDNTGKEEEPSSVNDAETGTSELPEKIKNGNQENVQFAFRDCFRVDGTENESLELEIPTLYQLLHSKTDSPSKPVEISSEAANFWCDLQSESVFLRLSGTKTKLHSSERLLKTLQLRDPDTNTASQNTILSDLDLEDPKDAPGALIQTKLMPPSHCRSAPGFLYQISRQWLSQHKK